MKVFRTDSVTYSFLAKCILLVLLAVALTACAKTATEKKPLVVQQPQHPSEVHSDQLQPGLAVLYFYDFYRHINQMPQGEKIRQKGKPGPPILELNHRFKKGKVFDSGDNQGVGMVITGYLHLDQPGKYTFQALSNDGFELFINENLLITDPGVHGDKLSAPGVLTAAADGWFPLTIKYYQRKGTATIVLYWQPPEADSFVVVPARAYGHLPQSSQ